MQFVEMGNPSGKTLMLLPGTACDYQTNFAAVLDRLGEKYHLICVNYDGFDGRGTVFPDMITVTEKIEEYIKENYNGKIDGAIGSSLGSSFVGQLIQRENIHIDHGIFGSPDLDQSGRFSAWLQSKLVVPLLTSFTKSEKKIAFWAAFPSSARSPSKTNITRTCSPGSRTISTWRARRSISSTPTKWARNI